MISEVDIKDFDATSFVNKELDGIKEKHGDKVVRAVSAAFISIQQFHIIVSLVSEAFDVVDGSVSKEAKTVLDRFASYQGHILGIVCRKLTQEQKELVMAESERINDIIMSHVRGSGETKH